MKKTLTTIAAAVFILYAFAAMAAPQAAQTLNEALSTYIAGDDMRVTGPAVSPFTMSYGGWITPFAIDERVGSSELGISYVSTRVWMRSTLWGASDIYVRGRYVYQSAFREKETNAGDLDPIFDLDAGYIKLSTDSGSVRLFIGRKFFVIGTGLVLNGRGDGAEFNIFSSIVDIKILGSYTGLLRKDDNPYNLSDVDIADGARRVFAGGSLSRNFYNQTVYLFGLAQIDLADETDTSKTRYQSQYYGGGFRGVLGSGFSYYGEFVYETGKSYLTGTTTQESVRAHAGQLGMNWFFDTIFKPAIILQAAYGSGDADRNNYRDPTGNAAGTDTGFLYFGTFSGGYALRPVLANIEIGRAGFAFSPFSWSDYRTLRRINIVLKYSYYRKYNSEAYINYGEAPFDNSDIGQGGDAALRWQLLSDLSFFANYAVFLPGAAYSSSEETRHFAMAGFNLIF